MDKKTVNYYNTHSKEYFDNSVHVNMDTLYKEFLSHLNGNSILDIGCGSGRDLKYFKDKGFQCEGIDVSKELCELASKYSGCTVYNENILEWNPDHTYDGLWACASLLHLTEDEIRLFFNKLNTFLNKDGILFCSMKTNINTGYDSKGRYFTNFTKELLESIIKENNLTMIDLFYTEDGMNRDIQWMNFIVRIN